MASLVAAALLSPARLRIPRNGRRPAGVGGSRKASCVTGAESGLQGRRSFLATSWIARLKQESPDARDLGATAIEASRLTGEYTFDLTRRIQEKRMIL